MDTRELPVEQGIDRIISTINSSLCNYSTLRNMLRELAATASGVALVAAAREIQAGRKWNLTLEPNTPDGKPVTFAGRSERAILAAFERLGIVYDPASDPHAGGPTVSSRRVAAALETAGRCVWATVPDPRPRGGPGRTGYPEAPRPAPEKATPPTPGAPWREIRNEERPPGPEPYEYQHPVDTICVQPGRFNCAGEYRDGVYVGHTLEHDVQEPWSPLELEGLDAVQLQEDPVVVAIAEDMRGVLLFSESRIREIVRTAMQRAREGG